LTPNSENAVADRQRASACCLAATATRLTRECSGLSTATVSGGFEMHSTRSSGPASVFFLKRSNIKGFLCKGEMRFLKRTRM